MARDTTSTRESDEGMDRALAAEAQARDAIAHCRAEAADIVKAAQARARGIEERADRRISRVRSYCLTEAEHRVGILLRQQSSAVTAPQESARRAHFLAAVERLAVRLTSARKEKPQ